MNEQISIFSSPEAGQGTAHADSGAEAAVHSAPKKRIRSRERTSSLDDIYKLLIKGVKTFFGKNNFKTAVIGVSGGVDSALTLMIAADALGAENVTALILPELGLTRQENTEHAKVLCDFLQVKYYLQPINTFLNDFRFLPWGSNKISQMNTKARIRAVLLYNFANADNSLVLGTSNKSEILLGYGTKFGDLAADIEVIGDLLKTDVIKLADHIGLPPEIVNKTPTAELAPEQTDEQEIGAAYQELDKVLAKLDLGPEGCIEHGLPAPLVQLVFRRLKENKHKCEPAPVIKVS